MRTKKTWKFLIAVTIIAVTFSLLMKEKNVYSKKIIHDSLAVSNVEKNLSITPAVDTKLSDNSATDELSEYDLKEFSMQVKNLNDVNKFDQKEFIPSTDHINGDRDYYETAKTEKENYTSESFIH